MFYRQIFLHTLDAVLLTRPDGSILAANPAACLMFGRTEEELISLGRGGVVDGSDPRLAAALEQRTRNGFATAELTFVRSDGSKFTGEVTSSVFQDADGRKLTSMIVRDLTDRRRIEAALLSSETRFRTLLDSLTNVAIQGYGPDGTILYWNRASESLYGYTEAEALGRNLIELIIPPDMRDEVRTVIRHGSETGEMPPTSELCLMGKGGRRVPVISSHAVVRAPGREPELFCLDVDISARKKVEEQLQSLNAELEQRVRERTFELERTIREMESFGHSVSHELRAPIARIEGFCHLLAESLDHDDMKGVRHCAERLGYSSKRIRAVIDALLSIHRISRADMNIERVNLSEIARQAVDELAEGEATRRLQVSIAPDVIVQGDRRMLGICLKNLLENAVKYTTKTARPVIEFGVVESCGDTVYFVRDNGAGFDMAFGHKLFQPFSRLHNEDEFTGSGIGLATVQRIVERHCGQIWAEASPGKGATIYFTLGNQ